MKISCITHPYRRDVMILEVDGEAWREIHTGIFGKRPSLPKGIASPEEWEKAFSVLEYQQAKNYIIRRLASYELPSTVLRDNLQQRLVSEDVIDRLLTEFCSLGYLNDEEWVERFVQRQVRRKLGPRAIAHKLAAKGFRDVSSVLDECNDEETQQSLIRELLATRYAKYNLSDFKERQKVVASLVRRGFSLSTIHKQLQLKN